MIKNNILYKRQFGFRKGHSTYMALVEFTNKISEVFEKGEFLLGIFLDLSKAFDCTVRPNKKETRFISEISSLPRKIETNCMVHYQEHFLFFHFDTKHIMTSQCMNEREQFKLMHVKNDLRRIMVLSTMTKFKLANPCQNKESKQKKHDKRDKINTNECLSTRPFVLNRGRPC